MKPGELLTLMIAGSPTERQKLLATHEAVLNTVELLDPKPQAMQREKNLAAGREVLASLTCEKLPSLINPQGDWALVLREGEVVGFEIGRDRLVDLGGQVGLESRACRMTNQPDGSVRTLGVVCAAAADRSTERWTATLRTSSKGGHVAVMNLTKQGATICFTQTVDDKSAKPVQKVLGAFASRGYLPIAMESLIPRVVDLGKPASYAFASFAPASGEMDVFTFTVVGPEQIELHGQKVQAVRTTVCSAEDAEEEPLWVDSAGRPLRQQSGTGESVERSTRRRCCGGSLGPRRC